MADVLITEQIAGAAVERLQEDFEVVCEPALWRSPEALLDKIAGFRAVVVRNQTQVTGELIAAGGGHLEGGGLEVIGRAGAGLDNIDVKAASEAGVVVAATPDQNSISVAELAIGLMLGLARHIPAADRDTRGGNWSRQRFTGIELYGRTLGVVGFGRIGFLTAMRAAALGMRVVVHDQFISPDACTVSAVGASMVSMEALLEQSDVITCHLPCTDQTRSFFNRDRFRAMKRTALFINTSRGEVVDEGALIEALQNKTIAGAALDVRGNEPPGESPLHEMDQVILTPHIAAFTVEAQGRVVEAVCGDIAAVLHGRPAINFVNFAQPRSASALMRKKKG